MLFELFIVDISTKDYTNKKDREFNCFAIIYAKDLADFNYPEKNCAAILSL